MIDKIKEPDDMLVSVIAGAPYGMVAIDLESKIILCNKLALIDLSIEEKPRNIKGKDLLSYLGSTVRLQKKIKTCLDQGKNSFDLNNVKVSDDKFLNVKGRKILNGMIITTADITESKNIQRTMLTAMFQGQENERQRLAKEIHDGIGPLLSTIKMNIDTLKKDISPVSEKSLKKIDNMEDLIQTVASDIRGISHALMPSAIKDFGLISALENIVLKVNESESITVLLFHTGMEKRLNNQIEMGLYRIIQELLNNTFKYAQANNITIQIVKHPKLVSLTVEDDGKGFDKNQINHLVENGIGLRNIKTRAVTLGGTFEIDSMPGKGVTATIQIPI